MVTSGAPADRPRLILPVCLCVVGVLLGAALSLAAIGNLETLERRLGYHWRDSVLFGAWAVTFLPAFTGIGGFVGWRCGKLLSRGVTVPLDDGERLLWSRRPMLFTGALGCLPITGLMLVLGLAGVSGAFRLTIQFTDLEVAGWIPLAIGCLGVPFILVTLIGNLVTVLGVTSKRIIFQRRGARQEIPLDDVDKATLSSGPADASREITVHCRSDAARSIVIQGLTNAQTVVQDLNDLIATYRSK